MSKFAIAGPSPGEKEEGLCVGPASQPHRKTCIYTYRCCTENRQCSLEHLRDTHRRTAGQHVEWFWARNISVGSSYGGGVGGGGNPAQ